MATVVEQEPRSGETPGRAVDAAETGAPAELTAPPVVVLCEQCFAPVSLDTEGGVCPNDEAHRGWIVYNRREDARFPVETLSEALPYLRAPFTPEAIRFKVQGAYGEKGCFVVAHIDARLVTERLNHVAGPHWRDEYEGTPDSYMGCHLTVFDVTRYDIGEGKGKGLRSDAFKRSAVKFGVGVSVYAIPRADLWWSDFGSDGKKYISRYQKDNKWHYRLEAAGEEALRKRYAKWLEQVGIREFGPAIDHGDVADSAGEAPEGHEEPTQSDLPAVQMPLTDERADSLRLKCRDLYATVPKRSMPKAAFESQLNQASKSHDDLEAFATRLEGMQK